MLLQTLRMRLPSPRYILTSALPAGEWALKHIPLSQASAYLDFINLMAYDFSGPWVDQAGHHAQLYSPRQPHCPAAALSADSSVRYYRSRGVPAEKIVLGIPAYGRSFLGCKGAGSRYAGHGGDEGTYEFQDLPRPNANEFVDMSLGAAWCEDEKGEWVSYDNEQTVRMKAAYAVAKELGGVFFWTGTGDKEGDRSLVDAAWRALHTG
jgi:chitinase